MATLERVLEIAAAAHAGQQDKAGKPYILHPIRVMLSVNTLDEQIAAVLHDTVEDTSVTLEDLADNMDLSRIPSPTPKDHARLEEYKRVRQILLAGPKE